MMIDFDEIFEGARVPLWLRSFAEDPDAAVEDLLNASVFDEPAAVVKLTLCVEPNPAVPAEVV